MVAPIGSSDPLYGVAAERVSPAPRTPDVAVLGGGIAGLCVARACARRGRRVVLVAPRAQQGMATSASAGVLAPGIGEAAPAAAHGFLIAVRDYYPDFLATIEEETGARRSSPRSRSPAEP